MPKERSVTIRPDWICETVSESNRTVGIVTKLRRYHQAAVPVALRALEHETVRAEPFDAIELDVRVPLGGVPA